MSSQEIPSTQQETYGDESESLEDEEAPIATDDGLVWGRLISNGGGGPNIELTPKGDPGGALEYNEYVIGRNAALVDVHVDFDGRISGKHCR